MSKKQAVLLIHGIGEQRPMDTLRSFVDAVWSSDASVQGSRAGAGSWSKPDTVSESFELRRLTTVRNAAEIRTDFFEFYWAHLMPGTTYVHLASWLKSLLLRRPSTVPRHLVGVYVLLLFGSLAALALVLYSAITQATKTEAFFPAWLSGVAGVLLLPLVGWILRKIVGDAARYLHVAPDNIQCRHQIRAAGIKLLAALNDRGYERIVVVGHSLGSVIGYDILNHAWASVHEKHVDASLQEAALAEVERQAVNPAPGDSAETLRAAQREYVRKLRASGNPWRVTDFVTLGSPLAHAAVLLGRDLPDLEGKQASREFPKCPPVTETTTRLGKQHAEFSFESNHTQPSGSRVAHHAAVFAATRWTNLYFPSRGILWGDVVGGPLSGLFGPGVRDVKVRTGMRSGIFQHTLYWSRPSAGAMTHVDALRHAIDLLDGKPRVVGARAASAPPRPTSTEQTTEQTR
ncbi:MAG: hypothetical protein EON58_00140 [Alphaproteobacteria bacterium]|nr:MAG: hypothetical protein EON58_00140 [Alphaproteobacteria bacterium]